MMYGFSNAKLIGFGLGLIAVLGFIALALHWKGQRDNLRDWQDTVVASTRTAAANPKLKVRDVPQQIGLLGESIATLKGALSRQSAEVARLGTETARQQASSAQALKSGQRRSDVALGTAARLSASSRSREATARPCEPSQALTESWR